MATTFLIAFRNLLKAQRRTLLLGIAIVLVPLLFFVLRTISSSVSQRLIDSATTLQAGHVNIGGFFKERKNASNAILMDREKIKDIVRKQVPEAINIIDRHRGWGRIVSQESSINAGLNGISFSQEQHFFESVTLAMESQYKSGGRDQILGDLKGLQEPNTAMIFATQAKKLAVTVGDTITVVIEGAGTLANSVDLRVVAVANDIGFLSNFSIIIPTQTLLELYQLSPETTGVVMLYLPDIKDSLRVMARLRKAFLAENFQVMDHDPLPFFMKFDKVTGEDWIGQKIDLTIWSDEISFIMWITTALDSVSLFVIGILAVIIVGGITNSMWMAMRERTREIGTMRAIGTQKSFIVNIFVFESLMLGLVAASLGTILGVGVLAIVNALSIPIANEGIRIFLMTDRVAFNIRFEDVLLTIGLFSLLTGLAALYPALKAAKLRPVEALMHVR